MKYAARTIEEAKKLRIIDDALFRLIAIRKDVCQEILRTLLDDEKLIVNDVTVQAREVSLNIPNIKILYITEYDILENKQAITHISRCQLKGKSYAPVNDGEDIILANAKSRQRNKHTYLLKLFLKSDSFYDEMYPALSDAIRHFKNSEKGRDEVCKSIETYATEEAIDAVIKTCIAHKDSLEETIDFVKEQFMKVNREYIISRFELLSVSNNN